MTASDPPICPKALTVTSVLAQTGELETNLASDGKIIRIPIEMSV